MSLKPVNEFSSEHVDISTSSKRRRMKWKTYQKLIPKFIPVWSETKNPVDPLRTERIDTLTFSKRKANNNRKKDVNQNKKTSPAKLDNRRQGRPCGLGAPEHFLLAFKFIGTASSGLVSRHRSQPLGGAYSTLRYWQYLERQTPLADSLTPPKRWRIKLQVDGPPRLASSMVCPLVLVPSWLFHFLFRFFPSFRGTRGGNSKHFWVLIENSLLVVLKALIAEVDRCFRALKLYW